MVAVLIGALLLSAAKLVTAYRRGARRQVEATNERRANLGKGETFCARKLAYSYNREDSSYGRRTVSSLAAQDAERCAEPGGDVEHSEGGDVSEAQEAHSLTAVELEATDAAGGDELASRGATEASRGATEASRGATGPLVPAKHRRNGFGFDWTPWRAKPLVFPVAASVREHSGSGEGAAGKCLGRARPAHEEEDERSGSASDAATAAAASVGTGGASTSYNARVNRAKASRAAKMSSGGLGLGWSAKLRREKGTAGPTAAVPVAQGPAARPSAVASAPVAAEATAPTAATDAQRRPTAAQLGDEMAPACEGRNRCKSRLNSVTFHAGARDFVSELEGFLSGKRCSVADDQTAAGRDRLTSDMPSIHDDRKRGSVAQRRGSVAGEHVAGRDRLTSDMPSVYDDVPAEADLAGGRRRRRSSAV